MLRYLHNKKAQAVMGEYMLVIFLVLAAIVSMTIYFRRAVQARIYDARNYMIKEVRERTRGEFTGNLYKVYEPYYSNVTASSDRNIRKDANLLPGATTGVFKKFINEVINVHSVSETAPPREFDRTTPKR